VLTASRGEEALAIAAKEPLDAIVLDVTTPGMNGWTVCERLKTSPLTSDVPVIVLTLDEGAVTVGRAERAGATAILAKPCPVDRLTFAIDLAIRTRGSAASAPAPIVQAPAPMPIITHTRKRRWARKPVKATVPARVDHLPVHLVNVSYGGVCVEIDQPTAELPASFDVMFPASDLLVHADAVWMNRSRDHWVCGAEIPDVTDAWRGLVDRLM
jgi:CheY-like chemotaxis protein